MPVPGPPAEATVEDLLALVNADAVKDSDEIAQCLALAESLIATYVLSAVDVIPDPVRREAVLVVAADQFNRRRAPNGILNQQYSGPEGSIGVPVRLGLNPLRSAQALLAPWVGGVTIYDPAPIVVELTDTW